MAQVYNEYLNIKTPRQLYLYLERTLGGKHSIELEEIEGDHVYCYVDCAPVEVYFTRGKRMSVCCFIDYPDELKEVLNVLSPIMWYRDPSSDPEAPIGPFIAYTTPDEMRVYEWDYVNPKARMAELVTQQVNEDGSLTDIEILHDFGRNPFEEDVKYGTFTGFLEDELADGLKTCHEIELYSTLQCFFDEYDEIVYCANRLDVDASNKLDAINYNIAYVAQQTKRFGIPMHAPTDEFRIDCPEFYAWFEWWKRNISKIVLEHPDIEQHFWTNSEILNIRPEGSYEEYLPLIHERLKELKAAEKASEEKDDPEYIYSDFMKNMDTIVVKKQKTDSASDDDKNR